MSAIGLVAALPSELAPLTRGWPRSGGDAIKVAQGRIGDHDVFAAACGMGAAAVTRACEAVLAAAPTLHTIVSIGYAGSLSCGLRPPDVCAISEVVEASSDERFLTEGLGDPASAPIKPQRLVTIDRVADPQEKRRLAEQHKATLVDMEAAAVARFARAHGLQFLCFKAVTDGPNERLPDFSRFTNSDGQLQIASFMAWALVHPHTWGPLRRLGKNSRLAAQELSNFVSLALSGSVQ